MSTRLSINKLTIIKIVLAVFTFIFVFAVLQRLFMPKYASYALEGNLIGEYYNSTMDQDVVLIGDCEVYANFSTVSFWENYGITSIIRGSPQQLVWHSYYLLEDTLRHARKKPQVVVFNVMAMQYSEPARDSEPYNRLNLDGMRLSPVKFRAFQASHLEDEDFLSYVFPLFRFKENWKELNSEDIRFFLQNPQVSLNGFMVRSDTQPAGMTPHPILRGNYDFGEKPMYYLEKMTQLARENDIGLILIKAPVLWPHWFDEWDEQIAQFAAQNDLLYINFYEHVDEIGLDWEKHTFNAGLHLNAFGAELMAKYLGGVLANEYNIPDRRSDFYIAQHWNEMTQQYYRLIGIQQEEISETGKISSFLID
ncbi:MAG: SGNH/GDSL hydrolase family protein [Oscillospiraceae bacterium]|nr:SGNH/GDSL hydrolase family protein [Oscillospiraceae bacterium]